MVARPARGATLNEYTRREEIRWTLVTVFVLVPAVAVAIVRLVLAEGPMVTDPKAIAAEGRAAAAKNDLSRVRCVKAANMLAEDFPVFATRAEQAEKTAKEAAEKAAQRPFGRPPEPVEKVDYEIPWTLAAPLLKHAKALHQGRCRQLVEAAAGASKEADDAWVAVRDLAKTEDPGKDGKAQQAIARKLLTLLSKAPLKELAAHTELGESALGAALEAATKAKANALVRAPLPQGLFPRGTAIGVGVAVALAALIVSYVSVRSASVRRGKALIALRRFANTPEAGLQAAAIVRLAAHHNGGEPGMVIGAALGGLLAAIASPTDNPNVFVADLFVAGSMGGLLIGLAVQWMSRTISGVSRWRERTKELGDIEKPTIPVALILGGVTTGLEKQFLRYFEALPVADAAMVVQKLAAQAEEQIIAAAEAAAQQSMRVPPAGAAGPWGAPPTSGGAPPGPGAPPYGGYGG
jgi:hypothetical protein